MTPRQKQILDLIRKWITERGYSPSYSEIRAELGIGSRGTIHTRVTELVRQGYLRRDRDRARGLELVNTPRVIEPDPEAILSRFSAAALRAELHRRGEAA